jgi:hypothetical protein
MLAAASPALLQLPYRLLPAPAAARPLPALRAVVKRFELVLAQGTVAAPMALMRRAV